MEELKKCPFCGGEAKLNERFRPGVANRKMYWVSCKKCGATQPYHSVAGYRKKVGAIGAWNTRKPMERIVERLEELRAEHEEREKDARKVGLTMHADLNGVKAYVIDDVIEIVKEEGLN